MNAEISYSIVGGNGSALFDVISSNGTVYAKNNLVGRQGEYRTVRVQAQDRGTPPRDSVVSVTLLITSENLYSPSVSIMVPKFLEK